MAILVLEDGRVFRGAPFGARGETFGEASWLTGPSGYQEGLTDPDRAGQVIIATAPHIGNTGWNADDAGADRISAAGLVVRDLAPRPSNWRATHSLAEQLAAQGVVAISGLDTRALTRALRAAGPSWVAISSGDVDPEHLRARLAVRRAEAG